jgi:hypothetical protein
VLIFKKEHFGVSFTMPEKRIINLPKGMPLVERISIVGNMISEWINSLEKPFEVGRDIVHLSRYHTNGGYSYRYDIHRGGKY